MEIDLSGVLIKWHEFLLFFAPWTVATLGFLLFAADTLAKRKRPSQYLGIAILILGTPMVYAFSVNDLIWAGYHSSKAMSNSIGSTLLLGLLFAGGNCFWFIFLFFSSWLSANARPSETANTGFAPISSPPEMTSATPVATEAPPIRATPEPSPISVAPAIPGAADDARRLAEELRRR